jgi:hypothetical protein
MQLWCLSEGTPTCMPYDPANAASCNLARVPAQAFVATSEFAAGAAGGAAAEALAGASVSADPEFRDRAAKVGKTPFVLLTAGAQGLSRVSASADQYLGADFTGALEGVAALLAGQAAAVAQDAAPAEDAAPASSGGGGGGGLSTTAIIAIAVASGVVAVAAVAGACVFYHRRQKNLAYIRYQDAVKEIQVNQMRASARATSTRRK